MQYTDLYIGGAWRKASSGETFAVLNPADEETLAEVASGSVEDAIAAVDAADAAFGGTKQSGLGREGGREGMLEFMETQYISTVW